jgi:hypothetical protein
MSKLSKKSLIASAVVGAFALTASNFASADALKDLQNAQAKTVEASAKSQAKITGLYEQTQELLAEYRNTVDEAEILKGYNDYVQSMVDDQNANIASLQKQIDGIDKIKRGVVPLMFRMIETLEKFVDADVPVNLEARKERIMRLHDVMNDSNVTTSEQFRLVLEAYEIEAGYGSIFDAYQGELDLGGSKITADFVHMGRISLMAQSLDAKRAWVWNNSSRAWEELGEEYLKPVTTAIRMARKQLPMDLAKLPVFAAGAQ